MSDRHIQSRLSDLRTRFNDQVDRLINEMEEPSGENLPDQFQMFRSSRSRAGPARRRRRRQVTQRRNVTFRMILLKKHVERYTSHTDGTPQCKIIVPLDLNEIEFREVLREKFPDLPDRFEFCKVAGDRKVIPIQLPVLCPAEIKACNVLGRSALYIRPLDIPSQTTSDAHSHSNPETTESSPPISLNPAASLGQNLTSLSSPSTSTTVHNMSSSAQSLSEVDHHQQRHGSFLEESRETDSEDLMTDMLASPPRPYSPDLQKDLVDILEGFRKNNLDLATHVTVVARRRRVLHSACIALHKSYFEWHKIPDIEFVGEMAEDYGGPRREFFRILMSEVQTSLGIFEGKPGNLLFAYNQDALQQNKYYTAGKLTAWSILHNGPGIKCLNQHLFQKMCGCTIDLSKFDLETFHDTDVQHRLEKILQSKTTAEMLEVKTELGDWIAECGIPNIYSASLADFPAIYQQIITHYMYHRVSSMIQQFIAGMNACGQMWQVVQRNWEIFAPLFTHTTKKLSRNDMRGLFDIKWSPQGSNKRDQEEDTIFLWEWWLMSIENNELDVTLEDILIFVTGADSVPPLGFPHNCEIQFYDQEPGSQRIPFSSTCALILYLPRSITEEAMFRDLMQMAIKDSAGFGKI